MQGWGQVKKIHIVGIGGAGMSAIAVVLTQQGYQVSGSDLKPSVAFERLRSYGVELFVGHDASFVGGADLVAISSAIPSSNPEIRWALEHGIEVVTRSELLPLIIADKSVIGVAGTHGKTTTTSMLALALVRAQRRPSFIVGGELNEIGTNAIWDDGLELVIEADESDGTFLHLGCDHVIVTNVEPDHLEYYGEYAALKDAFRNFVLGASGVKIVCADSPDARFLLEIDRVSSYGFNQIADYRISDVTADRQLTSFRVSHRDFGTKDVSLAVPGMHNVLNATAVIAMASELGADLEQVISALSLFAGVARRYQHRGQFNGAILVDDYAHLPGEIEVVINTARGQMYKRVVVVFQPHRYGRTVSLYNEFAASLTGADVVIVTDIYPAGESPVPGVTGELIFNRLREIRPTIEAHYVPHRNRLVPLVKTMLRDGDICLTLGAGDLTTLFSEITEEDDGR